MAMALHRSMTPVTEFGMETIGGTLMTPPVIFEFKPVRRAIVMPFEGLDATVFRILYN
jgi:hypothetical protein